MSDKNLYTKDSIESLEPLEFTRLKPGVYAGDTNYSTQLLVEIISNAVDEFRLGHGNQIDINLTNEYIVVEDYGQGFLVNEMRPDGKSVLEASFSVLNTSGKYREDGTYEGTSLGTYGIGSKITNFLSHWCEVITWRDNKYEHIWFKEGVFDKREVGVWNNANKPSGTLVKWQPSEEFFTNTEVELKKTKDLLNVVVCLCPGLTINLIEYNKEKTTYFSKNGLTDLVSKSVGDKEILKHRFEMKYEKDKYKIDLVMTYINNYSSTIIPYVNTGLTESGPHITQIKTVLTREFNKFFKEKKWLKDKDNNLSGDDVQEGMYLVFNITAPNVSYDAQVKSRITKIDTQLLTSSISENLQLWFAANEKEVKAIADKALAARKAREAAKKAREAIRNTTDKKGKKLLDLPTKLVDCYSKDRLECELLVAEGDSAAQGLIEARDSKNQAVFGIRGKIINLYKCSTEKMMKNQEVVNLIKAIGLELDAKTNKLKYDEKKLRYGKIIIAADADFDGEQIRNLLLTYFWAICPELIINGHIWVALPPLYRITTKKNEYIFLKDDAALEDYKNKHANEKYILNRNKGLGEQDASELEECLLNPETRNVVQITVKNIPQAEELLETLMGTNVPPRREYLLKYAEEANIN